MLEKIKKLPKFLRAILAWITIAIIFIPVVIYAIGKNKGPVIATVSSKKSGKKVKADDTNDVPLSDIAEAVNIGKSILKSMNL